MGDVWESDGVVVETWESSTEPGVTFTTVIREGDIVTGGSGVDLSDAAPQDLGTAASGVSDEASRADHVHDMPTAADIAVDASGFNGNLTTSDDTVQEIAQKLDDLVIPAAGIADPGGSNDDFLQRKSGAWTNRTVAQVRTDLAVPGPSPVRVDRLDAGHWGFWASSDTVTPTNTVACASAFSFSVDTPHTLTKLAIEAIGAAASATHGIALYLCDNYGQPTTRVHTFTAFDMSTGSTVKTQTGLTVPIAANTGYVLVSLAGATAGHTFRGRSTSTSGVAQATTRVNRTAALSPGGDNVFRGQAWAYTPASAGTFDDSPTWLLAAAFRYIPNLGITLEAA